MSVGYGVRTGLRRLPAFKQQISRLSTCSCLRQQPPPPPQHPYLSRLDTHGGSNPSAGPHLGPFPLPNQLNSDRDEHVRQAARSWRQLKAKEKAGRVVTQASSLFVVLVGGAVVVAVFYSFGTEVLVQNSPTRVFEDCVERVKASEELRTLLIPPLSFHGESSTNRLHRNRRISSAHSVDPNTGSEVLRIKFWVEARKPAGENGDGVHWSDLTMQEGWDKVKTWVGTIIWEDSSKPGSFVPRSVKQHELEAEEAERRSLADEASKNAGWLSWIGQGVVSVFGGLVPTKQRQGSTATSVFQRRKPQLGEFSSGEVFAELEKDPNSGNYVYRSLYIEIPDARDPNRYRVHIPTANLGPAEPGWHRYRFWRSSGSGAS